MLHFAAPPRDRPVRVQDKIVTAPKFRRPLMTPAIIRQPAMQLIQLIACI